MTVKVAVVGAVGLEVTARSAIARAGSGALVRMVPVAWLWMMVAATGLERLTVNNFVAPPAGSGSTVTETDCWLWPTLKTSGVGGTAT